MPPVTLQMNAISEKKDQRIPVMMSIDDGSIIDEWRRKQVDLPTRSEAIRRLVEIGLQKSK